MEKSCISIAIIACFLISCSPVKDEKRVNAQMFVKDTIGKEGVVECFAEGKHYGIRAVTEQTFYPGDDSFHRMHHHGVALESEQMAYRIYFDKRQTVDVYAKRTPRLELAESLWYPNDEQLAHGFGDDVLKVGNTIGVGSVRLWDKEKERLVNMDKFTSRTQRIVSVCDTAAVVEVEVQGLLAGCDTIVLLTRYSIKVGHRDMLCEVFASDSVENLVTGVQTIGNGETIINKQLKPSPAKQNTPRSIIFSNQPAGVLLASWGTDWPVNDTIKYAKETLGIAVSVPYRYAGDIIKDTKQNLVVLQPQPIDTEYSPKLNDTDNAPQQQYRFYCNFTLTAVSMKENNPPARTAQEFFVLLME